MDTNYYHHRLYEEINDAVTDAFSVHLICPLVPSVYSKVQVMVLRHRWNQPAETITTLGFYTKVEAVPVYVALCRAYRVGRIPASLRAIHTLRARSASMVSDARY